MWTKTSVSDAAAEFAIGLLLAASRKIVQATYLAHEMDWNRMNNEKVLVGKSDIS